MEQLLEKIIEADRKAAALLQQAQAQQIQIEQETLAEKIKIEAATKTRIDAALAKITEAAREEEQRKIAAFDVSYQEKKDAMNVHFEASVEKWQSAAFHNIIGE